MSITGPELVPIALMTLASYVGAWFFVISAAERRRP